MRSVQLPRKWTQCVWHNLFKADNVRTFDVNDNCLLDDFCDYCGYTIDAQNSDSDIVVSGPVTIWGVRVPFRLQITCDNADVITATYQVVSIPFIQLVVTFRERDGYLLVDDNLQDANPLTRTFYQPIADEFVCNGADAIRRFIADQR